MLEEVETKKVKEGKINFLAYTGPRSLIRGAIFEINMDHLGGGYTDTACVERDFSHVMLEVKH